VTDDRPFAFLFAPTIGQNQPHRESKALPMRRYLEEALGRPVEMIVATSYAETLAALRSGRADAAMLGEYATRRAEQEGGVEPLVAPVSSDETVPTYRSVVVTRLDSGIHDLAALRGLKLGLVDEQSTSGYLVPRAMLREAGIDPDRDISVRLLGNHRAVVEAVIRGDVRAGAFHESRLKPPDAERAPEYARLRVLARSRPIPLGPLVVRSTLDAATRSRLSEAMLRVHETSPEAAEVIIRQGHRFTVAAPRSIPTLKSIAALAGVSYATVSRVVNRVGYVAPETARRVNAIIDETGYTPNGNARLLQGQQVPLVGLLASLDPADPDPPLALIAIVQRDLAAAGIPMVVCPVGAGLEGNPVLELVRTRRFGGLLVTATHLADPELGTLARTGFAVIAVGVDPDQTAVPPGVTTTKLADVARTVVATLGIGDAHVRLDPTGIETGRSRADPSPDPSPSRPVG